MDYRSIPPAVPDDVRPSELMRGIALAAPFAALIWFVLLALLAMLIGT